MNKLNIFVSSTCYDLSQIRKNLKDAIESWGHNPLLSEFEEFPINPSMKTVDNCINTVREDANVFVLIVGNRYGSQIETGKSITNTEFLTAKEKGIPIYVFIDKNTLSILPVWRKNKDGDYTDIVDSTKIFDFIDDIRLDSKLWTFEFETAQNIESVLKFQLSYLFQDALKIRNKVNKFLSYDFEDKLSTRALNIILNKEKYFETEFFMQTLLDEIEKKKNAYHDHKYDIITSTKYAVFDDNKKVLDWMRQRTGELTNLVNSLGNLINNALPVFFAEPGVPADLSGLFYVSETYARIYEKVIDWSMETKSTCVNDELISLRNKLSFLSRKLIAQVWDFPHDKIETIRELKTKYNPDDEPTVLNLTLKIEIDDKDMEEYQKEFKKCESYLTT